MNKKDIDVIIGRSRLDQSWAMAIDWVKKHNVAVLHEVSAVCKDIEALRELDDDNLRTIGAFAALALGEAVVKCHEQDKLTESLEKNDNE